MTELPHGDKSRACTNCSRAKAKCVWPPAYDNADDICQRCSRNSLTCSKMNSVSKKRRGKATHAKVLEEKLDNIMSLLSRDREHITQADRSSERLPFSYEGLPQASPSSRSEHQPWTPSIQPTETTFPSRSGSISIAPGFQISFIDADEVLQEYMKTMLPQFPFVPLSCHSAYDMYKDTPLLLKTILWVLRPPSSEISTTFENWFRQHIAHRTVVLTEKTLELVQAIVVFLAWKDVYFYAAAKETSLVHLAIGILSDLGLGRPCTNSDPTPGSIVEDAAQLRNDLSPRSKPTSNSRRAILGVYYIASTLCTLLGKRHGLEYTPFLDDCCKQLLQDQEHQTDLILVNLIRIQQIAVKVHDTFLETPDVSNGGNCPKLHLMAVATTRNELDVFLQQLPDNLKWNHLLRIHYNAVRIRLFEPLKMTDKDEMPGPTHLRCRTLLECLESTQALCDTFRLIPIDKYPSLTFTSILHLALAIIKALKLLCVEDHAWDLATARAIFDVRDTLQKLTELFETANSLGHPRCRIILHNRPIFSDYAEAYRGIESWYMSKLGPGVSHTDSILKDSELGDYTRQYEGFELWNQLSDVTYNFTY